MGWFREDLYYRLAVFPIKIPPLRERIDDLDPRSEWILKKMGQPPLDPELRQKLKSYHWPGNVRELENVLERGIILSQGARLARRHFPEDLFRGRDLVSIDVHIDPDQTLKVNLAGLQDEIEKRIIEIALREKRENREQTAKRLGVSIKTLYNKLKAYDLTP